MSKSNSAVLDLNLNPLFDLEHQLLIAVIKKKLAIEYVYNVSIIFAVSADIHRQCLKGNCTESHQEKDGGKRNSPYTGKQNHIFYHFDKQKCSYICKYI